MCCSSYLSKSVITASAASRVRPYIVVNVVQFDLSVFSNLVHKPLRVLLIRDLMSRFTDELTVCFPRQYVFRNIAKSC